MSVNFIEFSIVINTILSSEFRFQYIRYKETNQQQQQQNELFDQT